MSWPAQPGAWHAPVRPRASVNVAGLVATASGALIALFGSFLEWYAVGGTSVNLQDIVNAAQAAPDAGLAQACFGVLFWLFLAGSFTAGILTHIGVLRPPALGCVITVGLGVLNVVLVIAGLNDLRQGAGGWADNSALGLWVTLLGLGLIAVSGLFIARRPHR